MLVGLLTRSTPPTFPQVLSRRLAYLRVAEPGVVPVRGVFLSGFDSRQLHRRQSRSGPQVLASFLFPGRSPTYVTVRPVEELPKAVRKYKKVRHSPAPLVKVSLVVVVITVSFRPGRRGRTRSSKWRQAERRSRIPLFKVHPHLRSRVRRPATVSRKFPSALWEVGAPGCDRRVPIMSRQAPVSVGTIRLRSPTVHSYRAVGGLASVTLASSITGMRGPSQPSLMTPQGAEDFSDSPKASGRLGGPRCGRRSDRATRRLSGRRAGMSRWSGRARHRVAGSGPVGSRR